MNTLFRKYQPIIASLTKHQLFRDWLGHNTLKVPGPVNYLFPSGHIKILEKSRGKILLAQYTVTPSAVYGKKLMKALQVLDMASGYLENFQEAKRLIMGELGLISGREFLPLLLSLPRFATYTGSPQAGAGGGNVTCSKNCYANTADAAWATNHDAATGVVEISSANTIFLWSSGASNKWNYLGRNYQSYDLTAMGVGAIISGTPTIGLYANNKTETLASQSVNIYNSSQANANDVATTDFPLAGTTAQATAIALASINLTAVNNWSLNAAGIASLEAAAGSVVKFCSRLVSDATNAEPSWASAVAATLGFAQAADANPPLLTATYTPASKGARIVTFI